MHMLPRVRELEQRLQDVLVVIGVHAGKYPAERRTRNIRAACDRLGVEHPVVNDRKFRIWRAYAVQAWPTIALVGPEGELLGVGAGEFDVDEMANVINPLVSEFERTGTLSRGVPDFGPDPTALEASPGPLRYPSRLTGIGDLMFVADAGNRRVIEITLSGGGGTRESGRLSGEVRRAWGGVGAGVEDGGPEESRFVEPQGLALTDGALYVADRGAHTIRRIDLDSGVVDTVAGTGELGRRSIRQGPALNTALRSPWGLWGRDGSLFVAMAGSHQVWRLDLRSNTLSRHAGTGAEGITDGPALDSTMAQPTGLCGGADLYVTDSESSSVRETAMSEDGGLRTLVGTGLFDHGDRDGSGDEVLLQHAQDVACRFGKLLVADTYNDKLKLLDPATRSCTSLPGAAGDGSALWHPAGIWTDGTLVVVADTNNHRLATVDADGTVETVRIEEPA